MSNKKRKIPKKNYFILLVIVILTALFTSYLIKMYEVSKSEAYKIAVINSIFSEVKYNELDIYLADANGVVMYITKSDVEYTRTLEKELNKRLKEVELTKEFIYVNLYDTEDYSESLKTIINDEDIDIPVLIIYEDGVQKEYITSTKSKRITHGEIMKFLEIHELITD